MKKIFLLILPLISTILYSQEYTPLLTDDNQWHFTTCYLGDCTRDVYYTVGEEEVNGSTYKRLYGYHYISGTFLLKEDVSEQQVFLLTIIDGVQRENLLYDFSMEIGDEIEMHNPFTPFPTNGGMYTLTSIESLPLVDGNDYKHYYLSPSPGNTVSSWDAVWVEGVGSLSILTAPGGNPNFDEVGELSCSFKDGVSFYSNLERLNDCEFRLNISDNETMNNVKFISEEGRLKIENVTEISEVDLYSIEGKLVRSIENISNENIVNLNTSNLDRGIYVIILKSHVGETLSHKVVVF